MHDVTGLCFRLLIWQDKNSWSQNSLNATPRMGWYKLFPLSENDWFLHRMIDLWDILNIIRLLLLVLSFIGNVIHIEINIMHFFLSYRPLSSRNWMCYPIVPQRYSSTPTGTIHRKLPSANTSCKFLFRIYLPHR